MKIGQKTEVRHGALYGVDGATDCDGYLVVTELTCERCGEKRVPIFDDEGRMAFALVPTVPVGAVDYDFEGQSLDGRWRCIGWLRDVDGRLVIAGLDIKPWTSGDTPALSTDTLRKIPLGRWLSEIHSQLSSEAMWLATGQLSATSEGQQWARKMAEAQRAVSLERGPKGYSEDHYRRIALKYLDLQQQGHSRGIVRELAKQEGPQWQTIRDWLHRATELGFLSPGVKGRAGRMPGPRLLQGGPMSSVDKQPSDR